MANALRRPGVALENLDVGVVKNAVSMQPMVNALKEGNSRLRNMEFFSQDYSPARQRQESELLYQCELNRAGRGVTRKSATTKSQFVQLLGQNGPCCSVSVAYGILREVPHLWASE
eukprot:CAMPEP_0116853008 /NCGR_PEP_ID=MMETSP0418-20121206/17642_1 /TAXON_ID=1158023 /ORGANISM="Astrosyne radiata, Strain 13vi08-1A" /LENGTH=115 /DNA_ID=CAMNT_0004485299 /DNA_START=156 /DNA_END=503 /DNA_ORIENTATION=-